MDKKELETMVNEQTEKIFEEKGLTEAIRKIKFGANQEKELTKEEKTAGFINAIYKGDETKILDFNDGRVSKDLSGGTAGAGLELIPTEFQADMIDRVVSDPVALRSKCSTIPVSSRTGIIPAGTGAITLTWEASDLNPLTATQITTASLTYNVSRLDGITTIARDLLSDTPVNLYNFVANQYQKAFVKAENVAIINGTGTNQPTGIRNTVGVQSVACATAATTNVLACDDLIGLNMYIDPTFRDGSVYIANSSVVKQMKQFKDNQNRYLWMNGDIQAGTPAMFNGYPVIEFVSVFPTNLVVNSKTTCTEVLFGNLSNYYILDKNEMGIEFTTQSDTAFKNHALQMKMWERLDGKLAIPAAFIRLTGFLA